MRTALGRLLIVFASALACAFGPMSAHAKPFPEGTDALFIGHSFFVPISRNFDDIGSASGAYPNHSHQEVFSGGRTGTPRSLWESRKKRRAVTEILATGEIDLLGFTHAVSSDGIYFLFNDNGMTTPQNSDRISFRNSIYSPMLYKIGQRGKVTKQSAGRLGNRLLLVPFKSTQTASNRFFI